MKNMNLEEEKLEELENRLKNMATDELIEKLSFESVDKSCQIQYLQEMNDYLHERNLDLEKKNHELGQLLEKAYSELSVLKNN